ncbi:MAG: hypothetical protein ACR2ID_00435 [Chthoniobacterales bacterium]
MTPENQFARVADATAEEVLRVIYGDDLQGCAVSLDRIAAVIRAGLADWSKAADDLAELHAKAFEAVQLLATPPADGQSLSPEDLRSLLGERLDRIRALAGQVLNATRAVEVPTNGTSEHRR